MPDCGSTASGRWTENSPANSLARRGPLGDSARSRAGRPTDEQAYDGEVEAMNATFLSAQRTDPSHVITPAPSHGRSSSLSAPVSTHARHRTPPARIRAAPRGPIKGFSLTIHAASPGARSALQATSAGTDSPGTTSSVPCSVGARQSRRPGPLLEETLAGPVRYGYTAGIAERFAASPVPGGKASGPRHPGGPQPRPGGRPGTGPPTCPTPATGSFPPPGTGSGWARTRRGSPSSWASCRATQN